jgi:hypothetical protein
MIVNSASDRLAGKHWFIRHLDQSIKGRYVDNGPGQVF